MNGLVFAPPLLETFCLFRPYDNVAFTSARRVILLTEQHRSPQRGLHEGRLPALDIFLNDIKAAYGEALGVEHVDVEWREFGRDGFWIQALLGPYVPLYNPHPATDGRAPQVINDGPRFGRTPSEAFENGFALLPRGTLEESRADPSLAPSVRAGYGVVNDRHVLLEYLVRPPLVTRTN